MGGDPERPFRKKTKIQRKPVPKVADDVYTPGIHKPKPVWAYGGGFWIMMRPVMRITVVPVFRFGRHDLIFFFPSHVVWLDARWPGKVYPVAFHFRG
jgi:hypothetical protein